MRSYNRFPAIIAELVAKVDPALAAGAEAVAGHARARVPVDEGDLRDAIHVDRTGLMEYSVAAGDGDVFYGHMVEFGTSRLAPQPFMVPAAGDGRDEVVALVVAALRSL